MDTQQFEVKSKGKTLVVCPYEKFLSFLEVIVKKSRESHRENQYF